MNKEDNEVYFLGKNKPQQHSKRIYLYTWNKWMDIL